MKQISLWIGATLISAATYAQQKISDGTVTPAAAINANALLDLQSTSKGLLLPRVQLTSTTAFAPLAAHVAGMTVYNTATAGTAPNNVTPGYYYNDGTRWVRIVGVGSGVGAWLLDGNTNAGLKTLGTKDTFDLPFITNNTEKMRILSNGNVGIGTATPNAITKLHIVSTTGEAVERLETTVPNQNSYFLLANANANKAFATGYIHNNGNPFYTINSDTPIGSGTSRMAIMHKNGYASINPAGAPNPSGALDITNDNKEDAADDIIIHTYSTSNSPALLQSRARGTAAAPANVANGDELGHLMFIPRINGVPTIAADVRSRYKGNGTTNLANLEFLTSGTQRMIINESGYVGIGTATPVTQLHIHDANTGAVQRMTSGATDGQAWFLLGNTVSNKAFAAGYVDNNGSPYYTINSDAPIGASLGSRLAIDHASGNVGINTISPLGKLHSVASAPNTWAIVASSIGAGNNNASGFWNDNSNDMNLDLRDHNGTVTTSLRTATSCVIMNGLGVGTAAPGEKLEVIGNTKTSGIFITSDRRLKSNIKELSSGLKAVMSLHPVSYDKKFSLSPEEKGTIHENGFIAQELQQVVPELVKEGNDDNKTLSVNYTSLIPVLTKAIQEQQAQIETLKQKIAELEARK